jgi:hypothetical protein
MILAILFEQEESQRAQTGRIPKGPNRKKTKGPKQEENQRAQTGRIPKG